MEGLTQQQYMLRHAIGGGLGAAGGDVVNQLLEYSFLSDDEKQNWSFDWGRLVNNTVHGAVQSAMHGRMQFANLLKACFCAGTPLRTLFGSKPIEEIKAGEWIVSRDESNPNGLLMAKQVEEVFVRTGRVWHLHVGGQLIRTTGEHPFYVKGRGWVAALELLQGDLLATDAGQWVPVEDVYDTGEYETVYNLRVADFHTYFVGSEEWGFSVWAHNLYNNQRQADAAAERFENPEIATWYKNGSPTERAARAAVNVNQAKPMPGIFQRVAGVMAEWLHYPRIVINKTTATIRDLGIEMWRAGRLRV